VGLGEEAGGEFQCLGEGTAGELDAVFAVRAGLACAAALLGGRGQRVPGPGGGGSVAAGAGLGLDEVGGVGVVAELAADEPESGKGPFDGPADGGVEGGGGAAVGAGVVAVEGGVGGGDPPDGLGGGGDGLRGVGRGGRRRASEAAASDQARALPAGALCGLAGWRVWCPGSGLGAGPGCSRSGAWGITPCYASCRRYPGYPLASAAVSGLAARLRNSVQRVKVAAMPCPARCAW
jgi:hypothetical protein